MEGTKWQLNQQTRSASSSASAIAIFIVVALTFRSLLIPLVLVMTVQCSIYLTMTFIGLSGSGMYYLALLIVQCILMGATIDCGILFTSYYREGFLSSDRQSAISHESFLHPPLTNDGKMIAKNESI
jgi:predicted RND superfamily exporter protein